MGSFLNCAEVGEFDLGWQEKDVRSNKKVPNTLSY